MLKSEAERVTRQIIEETDAKFTEEQIHAISQICLRVAAQVVEEALASWRPSGGGGGRPQFFA